MIRKVLYILAVIVLLGAGYILLPVDKGGIYAEVFSRLISKDDTYGGKLGPELVYVSKTVVNYPEALSRDYQPLGVTLDARAISAINRKAESLGIEVRWVDDETELQYNDLGEIVGGGVLVVFGELKHFYVVSEISAVIKVAGMAAGGTRYEFYKLPHKWKLTDSRMSWVT